MIQAMDIRYDDSAVNVVFVKNRFRKETGNAGRKIKRAGKRGIDERNPAAGLSRRIACKAYLCMGHGYIFKNYIGNFRVRVERWMLHVSAKARRTAEHIALVQSPCTGVDPFEKGIVGADNDIRLNRTGILRRNCTRSVCGQMP